MSNGMMRKKFADEEKCRLPRRKDDFERSRDQHILIDKFGCQTVRAEEAYPIL